jgi:hypothetical protein
MAATTPVELFRTHCSRCSVKNSTARCRGGTYIWWSTWLFNTITTILRAVSRSCRNIVALRSKWNCKRLARSRIWTFTFNINALSDLQSLQRYRFRRNDVGFIAGLIPWENGFDAEGKMRASQKRYLVDPLESTAIMLRRLAKPSRWIDVQIVFGNHRSALSEILYHALELFYGEFGSALTNWPHGLVETTQRHYLIRDPHWTVS